ncbi:MAG: MFS transporter [Parachlamydiales bacterium]|nr:MFS transporter [Parachlamydiales bacterium]
MRKLKISLLPLFFTAFIDFTGLAIVIPIFSPLFLDPNDLFFNANTPETTRTLILGFLLSSFPLAQFFGSPLLGALSDRFGRKPLLIASMSGTAFSYLALGMAILTHNFYLLFASRIVAGFMAGNISVVQSAIADVSEKQDKARNFSLIALAFSGGLIIGPFLGARLSDPHVVPWFNDTVPFCLTSFLSLCNVLFVGLFFQETLKKKRDAEISVWIGFKRIAQAIHQKGRRQLWLMVLCYGLAWAFLAQFFQVFLIQKFGFTKPEIGNFYSYWAFWSIFTQFAIARPLFPHFKQKHLISISLFLLLIAVISLTIPNNPHYLYGIIPFVSLFQQIAYPNVIALVSNAGDKLRQGEMLGVCSSIQAASQVLPATISGSIVILNPTFPTLIGSFFIFLTLIFFILYVREQRKKI